MRKIISFLFLIVLICGIAAGWIFFGSAVNVSENKYLYVPTGATYQQVKDSLTANKFLSGTFRFEKASSILKYKNVKPGRYKLSDGMSLFNLVRMLKNGNQSPVNLTIIKLRTREDLAKKLADNFEFNYAAAINFMNDSVRSYGVDNNTVMTLVFPDTYTLNWNSTPSRVFKKIFAESDKFWTSERKQKAAKLQLTEKEVYTLASIVEEETNMQADKGKIASVYLNRLHKGMKLAADPTVKFALKDFSLKRIYLKYLSTPSLYNTYQHTGLPPGPICTPSEKTIDAVLDAPQTDYLFFVAKPDFSGYSNFASSFAEHDKNAKAYQQALNEQIRIRNSKDSLSP